MVLAAAPSRSPEQAICDAADSLELLVQLVTRLLNAPPTVLALPGRSNGFVITQAIDVGTRPVRVLPANPNRYSFVMQTAQAGTFMVADGNFDVGNTPAIQTSEFGLDGYTGEVWVAAQSGPVSFTIIEQLIR